MSLPLFQTPKPIDSHFKSGSDIVLFNGDIKNLLAEIPDNSIQLIITSPPYNLGKDYENRIGIEHYLEKQAEIITELYRVLKNEGSLCWQVGNFVDDGENDYKIVCVPEDDRNSGNQITSLENLPKRWQENHDPDCL